MLIQIESVAKDGPRKVRIEPAEGDPIEFTADSLKDAHKLIKQGRSEGWEAVAKPKAKPVAKKD